MYERASILSKQYSLVRFHHISMHSSICLSQSAITHCNQFPVHVVENDDAITMIM
jgi:hypothetical protein